MKSICNNLIGMTDVINIDHIFFRYIVLEMRVDTTKYYFPNIGEVNGRMIYVPRKYSVNLGSVWLVYIYSFDKNIQHSIKYFFWSSAPQYDSYKVSFFVKAAEKVFSGRKFQRFLLNNHEKIHKYTTHFKLNEIKFDLENKFWCR